MTGQLYFSEGRPDVAFSAVNDAKLLYQTVHGTLSPPPPLPSKKLYNLLFFFLFLGGDDYKSFLIYIV